MRRLPPLLVSVAIVVGAFLIPRAEPAELSALEAYQLLELPVGPAPAEGQRDERPPLWKVILDSPAAERREDGLHLRMHGARHVPAPQFGGDPILLHGSVRSSLMRGLRQFSEAAEDPAYHGLRIDETETADWGANFDFEFSGDRQRLQFGVDDPQGPFEPIVVQRAWSPPTRDSIVPPIVAVVLAILFRRPLVALVLAVLSGALLLRHEAGAGWIASLGGGAYDVFGHYLKNQLVDLDRLEIIGFVFFMLAMVGVMTRAGGIRGLMDVVAARAKDAQGTQFATFLMGLVVFFDDYANTILVGSTMRPLTDRFRISREKLSYIVDSTAAPVAGLSIFSTWIAFEVSTFNGQLPAAGLDVGDGYAVFLRTVPYSFYCFLTIFFVGLITLSRRDLGPMLSAERRARSTGKVIADGATPMVSEEATAMEPAPHVDARASRAILPLLTFMGVTLLTILLEGGIRSLSAAQIFSIEGMTQVLYEGSGSWPLLVGSVAGFLVAAIGALRAGLTGDIVRAAWTTVRAMGVGFAILYLAWMIGKVCEDLGTATFLTGLLGETIDGRLLPTLLFVLAGGVAFATGSSWSTMSILLPLVVGLAYTLGLTADLVPEAIESGRLLMVMSIGAVLSGAIFGDHCSPISDTTVMSSIASASDHIDHVRTQIPYALLTMFAAVVFGYFPATYYGLSPWIGLGLGALFLTLVVFLFGRRADDVLQDAVAIRTEPARETRC